VDTLRVAVLAALNIADEMHAARRKYESLTGDLNRAAALSGMLDRAIESERRAG
jgi:cell division protein ZapA